MRIGEVMKREPTYVQPHESCRQAARRMRDGGFGFLPVCDDRRRVIGTITDRDIAIRIVAEGRQFDLPVGDVMSCEVVACRPDEDVERARKVMSANRKARLLVLDDRGCLEGVLSSSDLATATTSPGRGR